IKNGYITLKNGARIGLCGELVIENNIVKTIKNFSSLNIRIPHQVKNCSLDALMFLYDDKSVLNTLIVSPPGGGKTTFIRDLCYQFSTKFLATNILVLDERGEIGCCLDGVPQMDLGGNVDILTNCSKSFGLECGIRTMNPEVIFLDEIANEIDAYSLNYAVGSGVKIVATAHSNNLESLYKKPYLKHLFNEKVFDRIVILSSRNGAGTLEYIYNENKNCLYCAG
ncbi:MAG: stage III sporulation protein AA, partial [Clostridia bacterium]|nr:stage III sporulation protein AA [Clostridia bacterium]